MATARVDARLVDGNESGTTGGRLLALDAFRGLAIMGMVLVNNPGSWGELYWPLAHAHWHGWTPTDLVFPFFLFIVGTSLSYSLRKYRRDDASGGASALRVAAGQRIAPAVYWRILRRTLTLILLGLMLNATNMTMRYLWGEGNGVSFATLRWPGVLQRIALVYFIASLLVLHLSVRKQMGLAAVLLLGYWAMLAWLPTPGNYQANLSPSGNVVRLIDLDVIGKAHMYTRGESEKTDPEGLMSTLPAVVTALLGYWTGLAIQRRGANPRTVWMLIGCGVVLAVLGLAWGEWFPINKKLWTSSFVLLTGGLAMVVLASCLLKFDVWGWRRLARPWEIAGVNAIFVFVASGLMANVLNTTSVQGVSTKQWIYQEAFTSWIREPKLASLAFAAATVAFWWLVLWGMWRRGWSIRV